jgi:hypothetical protein
VAEGRGRDVVTRDACLASWVRSDLAALRWHWSPAYCIDVSVHGDRQAWTAGRRDGRGSCRPDPSRSCGRRSGRTTSHAQCPAMWRRGLPKAAERPAGRSQHGRSAEHPRAADPVRPEEPAPSQPGQRPAGAGDRDRETSVRPELVPGPLRAAAAEGLHQRRARPAIRGHRAQHQGAALPPRPG